jgi:uncharacterized membrane protein (UPF0127 family)
MRRLSVVLAVLLLTAPACDRAGESAPDPTPSSPAFTLPSLFGRGTATIEVPDDIVTLEVEIARTDEAHQRGLQGRTSLPSDSGMVFLFPDEQPRRFWMKDTLIPLSIAYFRADGTIVSIRDMDPCTAEPCPLYDSGAPAQGALEVNQGFFEAHGVRLNDVITITEG